MRKLGWSLPALWTRSREAAELGTYVRNLYVLASGLSVLAGGGDSIWQFNGMRIGGCEQVSQWRCLGLLLQEPCEKIVVECDVLRSSNQG